MATWWCAEEQTGERCGNAAVRGSLELRAAQHERHLHVVGPLADDEVEVEAIGPSRLLNVRVLVPVRRVGLVLRGERRWGRGRAPADRERRHARERSTKEGREHGGGIGFEQGRYQLPRDHLVQDGVDAHAASRSQVARARMEDVVGRLWRRYPGSGRRWVRLRDHRRVWRARRDRRRLFRCWRAGHGGRRRRGVWLLAALGMALAAIVPLRGTLPPPRVGPGTVARRLLLLDVLLPPRGHGSCGGRASVHAAKVGMHAPEITSLCTLGEEERRTSFLGSTITHAHWCEACNLLT
eukprot:519751-Prymnesium_polylepis.1